MEKERQMYIIVMMSRSSVLEGSSFQRDSVFRGIQFVEGFSFWRRQIDKHIHDIVAHDVWGEEKDIFKQFYMRKYFYHNN
jgi:hypothetical protein